ncbi:unnamed protein product [Ectocarpus fasciculatus]
MGLRSTLHRGRMAGIAAVLGNADGLDVGSGHHAPGRGVAELNPTLSAGISGDAGGAAGRLRPRRVEGLYRDRPALIRAYNVVACLTNQFSRVLLSPGGVNVSGSKAVVRSHFLQPAGSAAGGQARDTGRRVANSGSGGGGGGSSGPGVVSINGWEFGEDPREQLYSMAHAAARNIAVQGWAAPSRFTSPRMADDRRSGGGGGAVDALVPRTDAAGRGDGLLQRDLWMPLWLLMPQDSFTPADKLRPVPNAFEMDAVVWKPGPFGPETDPGSGWLIAARVAALEAPNHLLRVAVESEPMLDDSAKSLEVKDRFRQGKIGGVEFARFVAELKRTGADRIERRGRRGTVAAGAGVGTDSSMAEIAAASGLTVSTASSAPGPSQGRDGSAGGAPGRGSGTDASRDPYGGPAGLKSKRPTNSTGVLSKLGGRLVAGLTTASLKADQGSGSNSPTGERARSEAGGVRRLRSPRRGSLFGSPRHEPHEPRTSEGSAATTGGSGWRPWTGPGSASRKSASDASYPERPAPSPAGTGTPVRGGDVPTPSAQGGQAPAASSQLQHLGQGVAGAGGAGPLTASEIDQMSSVSTTSTVLTDLSLRMEKIEDLLSKLLEASTGGKGMGGGGGGGDILQRWGRVAIGQVGGTHDPDARSSEGGTASGVVVAPGSRHSSNVLQEDSAGELMGAVKDTTAELRQVRRRLRQLELEEAAAKAAAAAASGSSSQAPPAPTMVAPRSPQPSPPPTEGQVALPDASDGGTSGVNESGGEHFRGVRASELPVCRNDSLDEEEDPRPFADDTQPKPSSPTTLGAAQASGQQSPTSSDQEDDGVVGTGPRRQAESAATGGEFDQPLRDSRRNSGSRGGEESEEQGVGMTGGREDEAKGEEPDDGGATRVGDGSRPGGSGSSGGAALRRPISFGLSPISEAPA